MPCVTAQQCRLVSVARPQVVDTPSSLVVSLKRLLNPFGAVAKADPQTPEGVTTFRPLRRSCLKPLEVFLGDGFPHTTLFLDRPSQRFQLLRHRHDVRIFTILQRNKSGIRPLGCIFTPLGVFHFKPPTRRLRNNTQNLCASQQK